jgi:putative MATE family efflux protein
MKDLTQGPIPRHLVAMSVPIAAGMVLQTLYLLIDLYFVARLGDAAIAGVGAAGNVMFAVFALTQMLGVGTVALMSHAVGRKDRDEANHIFNQSVALATFCAFATIALGYALTDAYMGMIGADAPTMAAGTTFLRWYIPGLALQFALVVMGSALRGTGIVQPTMIVQALTVVLNAILAPVLIAGWGTGMPMGVAGAALASTLSVAGGVAVLAVYFLRLEKYVRFDASQWRPRTATWLRMLNIGLPAGGEFALLGVYSGLIYWVIRDFGAAAQAGFGIGTRLTQAIFLPALAIAFGAAPLAGQNFGARLAARVRETFRVAAISGGAIMAVLAVFTHWKGELLVRAFTSDPEVIAFAAQYLAIISWNFVAVGLVFTCSSMFQALGNTWPSLASSGMRLVTFALPAIWLSTRPGFEIVEVWHLSVATVLLQAIVSLTLVSWQLRIRLDPSGRHMRAPAGGAVGGEGA